MKKKKVVFLGGPSDGEFYKKGGIWLDMPDDLPTEIEEKSFDHTVEALEAVGFPHVRDSELL